MVEVRPVIEDGVRSGDLEALLPTFAAIGESLYASERHLQHPARPSEIRTRGLLDPRNPTVRRCRVRLFVDERAPARVAAIVNPRLVENGAPVGLLGFFESADDPAAATALLNAAARWLYDQGCAVVRGPMNFTTWHDYRFAIGPQPWPGRAQADCSGDARSSSTTDDLRTESESQPSNQLWIAGEPYHHDYYAALWSAAGFRVTGQYASHWVADLDATLERFRERAERASAAGITLRGVEPQDLPALYRLAIEGFGGNWMYSAIDPEEFALLYSGDRLATGAPTSYVAVANGAPVGFYYTFLADLPGGVTSIGKTIVVDSALRDRGIYHLLMSAWLREARTAGRRAIAALFHLDGSPALMGWQRAGDAFKNYVLFEHQRS